MRGKKASIYATSKAPKKSAKKVISISTISRKKAVQFSKKYPNVYALATRRLKSEYRWIAQRVRPSSGVAALLMLALLLPFSSVFAKSYALSVNSVNYSNNGTTITISGSVNVTGFVGQESDQWVRINWGDGVVDVTQAMTDPFYVKNGGNFTINPFIRTHTYGSVGPRTLVVKIYHSTQQGNDSSGNIDAGQVTIDTENTLLRCTDGLDNDHDSTADFADADCSPFVPPVLDPIGNKTVDEGVLLSFSATASDPPVNVNPVTFSLSAGAPAGASITSGGAFTWTPTEAQGPGSNPVTVIATDVDGNTDSEAITVTVNEVATTPILAAIGNQSVNENSLLQFTIFATDSDLPVQTLSYSAANLPTGASFNSTTRTLTWIPSFNDAAGSPYTAVHFEVSDGALTAFEDIDITVNDVNRAPVLDPIGNQAGPEAIAMNFTIAGSDPDGDATTFSVTGLPSGATFDSNTGDFSWTPTILQAGNYSVTFTISDGSLTDEEVVPIDIGNVNQTPNLDPIGDSTTNEESSFAFTAVATDADVADTLTFSLSGTIPTGASIDSSSGDFTWTPAEDQGPGIYTFTVEVTDGSATDAEEITVTVNEINVTPVASDDADTTPEDTQLVISLATLLANDTDADIPPPNTLAVLSVQNSTNGIASISGTDVLFDPMPDFNNGSGIATFEYTLSDGDLTDTGLVSVDVTPVNDAPAVTLLGTDPFGVLGGTPFIDPGADGTDLEDGVLTASVTGTVDTSVPGEYVVTYTVTDSGNLSASVPRTVVVSPIPVENTPGLCSDGSDNDNDGLIDLSDPDCSFLIPPPHHSGGGGGGGSGSCGAGFVFDPVKIACVPQGQVLGASTSSTEGQVLGVSCGIYMNQHLRQGSPKNDPGQVTKLQDFLTKNGFGSFKPTGFFGPLTFAAVKNFQAKYADEILKPWNISAPTGLVYITTARKLNFIECPDLMASLAAMPELIPWNLNPNAQ